MRYKRFGGRDYKYAPTTPKDVILKRLVELRDIVQGMADVYEKYPELNNEIDIQKIAPMSLDEWACEISEVIENNKAVKS